MGRRASHRNGEIAARNMGIADQRRTIVGRAVRLDLEHVE